MTGANLITTFIGIILVVPLVRWEYFILSHSGNGWLMYLLIFAFPWLVWAFCYQLSWRCEARLLGKWLGDDEPERATLMLATQRAHRWSYALLAISTIGWFYFIFPDI